MEARHFDRLTRLLASRFDRRAALGALVAGGSLAGIARPAAAAPEPARCVEIGDPCRKKKDRCCNKGECKGQVCKKTGGGGGGGGGTVSQAAFDRFFTGGPGLNRPKGIAFSTDDDRAWFVSENLEHRIQVFDSDGAYMERFTSSGNRQFNAPRGVAVYQRQFLYVANSGNSRVLKLKTNGDFVTSWTNGGSGGSLTTPIGIAVDNDGNVYVADSGNDRIVKFDSDGNFLQQFGPDTNNLHRNSLSAPEGVAVSSNGKVYVADTGNNRVVMFKSSGEAQKEIRKFDDDQRFNSPRGLTLDRDDNVFVADSDNDQIVVFAKNGDFLFRFGGCCSGQGQFNTPYDCATDRSGHLAVADMANNRIEQFTIS